MKQVDVAETLVEEADAIGEEIAFDKDGNRVQPPAKPQSDDDE